MILVSGTKASEVLEPGKESLDFPAAFVASERSPILGFGLFPVGPVGRDHLDSPIIPEGFVQRVAVVSLVADEPFWHIFEKSLLNGGLDQFHLVRRGAFDINGDRKTRRVCNCHDLGAFSAFRRADKKAPFFAGTKDPSM